MNNKPNITAILYDKRGKVLAIGKNSYIKTHPLQAHHAEKTGESERIFLHAEIHAITKCKQLDKAYRLVVTRYNRKGKPMLAKPCPVCVSAISQTNIKVVEHT